MFAFAICDAPTASFSWRATAWARSRSFIRPARCGNRLVAFASELKALLEIRIPRTVSEVLDDYLSSSKCRIRRAIGRHVKLAPAHGLVFKDGRGTSADTALGFQPQVASARRLPKKVRETHSEAMKSGL